MLHNWSLPYIRTWSFVKAIPQKDICVLCGHLMQVFAVIPTVISGEVNSCYLQDKFYGQAMGHVMQNDGNIYDINDFYALLGHILSQLADDTDQYFLTYNPLVFNNFCEALQTVDHKISKERDKGAGTVNRNGSWGYALHPTKTYLFLT